MMIIPPFDANDYVTECEFEGQVYFVRMSWNSEGEFWVLGLEDYTHSTILSGIRVVADAPLLKMFRHYDVPPGELVAVKLDVSTPDIGRDDFIIDAAELVYIESTEDAPVLS